MKKTLLFLGLLGMARAASAQGTPPNLGPWVQVNTTNYGTFAPGYRVTNIATVSPTQCWAVTEENSASGKANTFLRTNNPAGTEFDFNAITAPGANASYETGNISPVGNSITTAVAGNYGSAGGGEILRTSNGGVSWTKVHTYANTTTSFQDFIYMFDALRGVSVGDPTLGYFEIYTTADGGLTWTRVPQANIPPVLNANEYGLVHSFFGLSGTGTIWFGGASSADTDPVRVYKSTNFGQNWTASPVTTLTGTISRLAFKDANNGIAYNVKLDAAQTAVTAVNVIRTADGGATWAPITPVNTATGSFFRYDIDGVNGNYYSVGARFPTSMPAVAADFGSSYSTDGINWTNLNNSQGFFAFDLIASGTTNAAGYAGAATDASGVGGMYKSAAVITASRNAALQSTLSVYPNPSASGVFNVNLGSDLKAGATLTVSDALGRTVKTQALNAAVVGSKMLNLDLSGEKTGVYTLQIRTEAGIATQKIVIE